MRVTTAQTQPCRRMMQPAPSQPCQRIFAQINAKNAAPRGTQRLEDRGIARPYAETRRNGPGQHQHTSGKCQQADRAQAQIEITHELADCIQRILIR